MDTKSLPEIEVLRKLLDYDPATGSLRWNPRDVGSFASVRAGRAWNARLAGNEALGSVNCAGYKTGAIFNEPHYSHRVIWAIYHGEWPKAEIDHINGNRSDNRICNLRAVSHVKNCQNFRLPSDNTSGVMGVDWVKKRKKWRARIKANGTDYSLGYFAKKEDAVAIRKAAEREHGFHPNHGKTAEG